MVAQTYYLPCTCGKNVVVDSALAGATTNCQCGRTLQVPTLRELRLLQPVVAATPAPTKAQSSARPMGCLFGALLAAAVIAGLSAFGAWFLRQQIDTSYTIEKDLVEGNKKIDGMAVDQAYELWKNFDQVGLGPPQPPPYIRALLMAGRLERITQIAAAVSALCIIAAGAVAFVDAKNRRNR